MKAQRHCLRRSASRFVWLLKHVEGKAGVPSFLPSFLLLSLPLSPLLFLQYAFLKHLLWTWHSVVGRDRVLDNNKKLLPGTFILLVSVADRLQGSFHDPNLLVLAPLCNPFSLSMGMTYSFASHQYMAKTSGCPFEIILHTAVLCVLLRESFPCYLC